MAFTAREEDEIPLRRSKMFKQGRARVRSQTRSLSLWPLFMGFTSPPRKMISRNEVLEDGSNQDLKN
jgi:plasmid replication initiation protein